MLFRRPVCHKKWHFDHQPFEALEVPFARVKPLKSCALRTRAGKLGQGVAGRLSQDVLNDQGQTESFRGSARQTWLSSVWLSGSSI